MSSLTSSDVETWLDVNVDWLCDYLQRRKSVLGPQSLQTVSAQCRGESTVNQRHSQTHKIAVSAVCEHKASTTPRSMSSPHHHHQQQQQQQQQQMQMQRGVTMPTRSPDYTTSNCSLFNNYCKSAVNHPHLRWFLNFFVPSCRQTSASSSVPSTTSSVQTTPQPAQTSSSCPQTVQTVDQAARLYSRR